MCKHVFSAAAALGDAARSVTETDATQVLSKWNPRERGGAVCLTKYKQR